MLASGPVGLWLMRVPIHPHSTGQQNRMTETCRFHFLKADAPEKGEMFFSSTGKVTLVLTYLWKIDNKNLHKYGITFLALQYCHAILF